MGKIVLNIILIVIIILLVAVMAWAMIPAVRAAVPFNFSCRGFNIDSFALLMESALPEDAARGLTCELPADGISSIDMDFLHENIEVVPWEGGTVRVEQTSSQALSEDNYMRYGVADGKLIVESPYIGRMSAGVRPDTRITVSIPETLVPDGAYSTASGWVSVDGGSYDHLSIDTSSGKAQAFDVIANDVDIDTASGDVEIQNLQSETCRADTASGSVDVDGVCRSEFKAGTASGSIDFSGTSASFSADAASGSVRAEVSGLREFDADSASGDVSLTCMDADILQTIHVDTASGAVTLRLPENNGFEVDYDSVSGTLRNADFEMLGDRHKDGVIAIEVDTASGDLTIGK